MAVRERPTVLAVEIGGTKLQAAVGRLDSVELRGLTRSTIDRSRQAEGILDQLESMCVPLCRDFNVDEISVGFGGPVDRQRGRVIQSNQVEGWNNFELADWFREQCGVPTGLLNDCDAAALAESTRGAACSHDSMFYVTIGTGIGGGHVINRRVLGTERPAVAEIGQLVPNLSAPAQTVESWASGTGIETHYAKMCLHGSDTEPSLPDLKVPGIAARAADGDTAAIRCLSDASRVLGWAIAQVASIAAPEIFVLGGGVSLLPTEQFLEPVRKWALHFTYRPLRESLLIVPAQLQEEVVLHGAIEATMAHPISPS